MTKYDSCSYFLFSGLVAMSGSVHYLKIGSSKFHLPKLTSLKATIAVTGFVNEATLKMVYKVQQLLY
jgi:hypothetical protein